MSVRRREDSAHDAWLVDFRAGGKRYRYTVRAKDDAEALAHEARNFRSDMGTEMGTADNNALILLPEHEKPPVL